MSKIIKGSTKLGQQLIDRTRIYEGFYITDVYDRPSIYKENAWQSCYQKFRNTDDSEWFHICSHNTFQFSVSWKGLWGLDEAIFLETANNSYIILVNK